MKLIVFVCLGNSVIFNWFSISSLYLLDIVNLSIFIKLHVGNFMFFLLNEAYICKLSLNSMFTCFISIV